MERSKVTGALRGMMAASLGTRLAPDPVPPSPIERESPSAVAALGVWQVAQEMLRLPLRILSKKRNRPTAIWSALVNCGGTGAVTPAWASNDINS